MNNYKCGCGNENDFFIEHNSSQCGLYCGECGKWQKWMNKDEERLFKHKQELAEHDNQIRNEVISEFRKQLDIKIDFGGLENRLLFFDNYDKIAEKLKGGQNDIHN